MLDHTVTYAGIREALDALAPYKMAVLTNKPVRFSQAILRWARHRPSLPVCVWWK